MLIRFKSPLPLFPSPIYWVLALSIFVIGINFVKRGFAHPEIQQYVPHYLSHRPLAAKIFDFEKVEVPPVYRPRPLSYLVDNYDVAFIGWSARMGYPHLLSLSFLIFKILDFVVLLTLFHTHFGLHRGLAILLSCLLLTTPSMLFSGSYFRSAKPGSLFFMLLAFYLFCRLYRAADGASRLRRALMGGLASLVLLIACLFDEVPVAFSMVGLVLLGTAFLLAPASGKHRVLACLPAVAAAVTVFMFYNFFLHPRLITQFTGQTPDFKYQQGAAGALLNSFPLHALGAVWVLFESFGFVAGNIPAAVMGVVVILLCAFWMEHGLTPSRLPGILIVAGLSLLLLCLFGIISRHPPIMSLAVRRTNYLEPFELVFLVFGAASLAKWLRSNPTALRLSEVALLALVISNLVSVPNNMKLMVPPAFFNTGNYSLLLLSALENGTGALTAAEKQSVIDTPLYTALHNQMALGGKAKN